MPKIVAIHDLTTEQQQKIKDIAPDYELLVTKAKELTPSIVQDAEIMIGWSRSIQEDIL
ncbi:D-2-hydroxyacid dehydrogenase, partial [Clostridium perfringens]